MPRKANDKKNLILRGKTWWFRKTYKRNNFWYSLKTGNLGTAQDRRDAEIRKITAGEWDHGPKRSFNELAEKFALDHFPTLKPKSRKRYHTSLKHLLEQFDGTDIRDIGPKELKKFENWRRGHDVSSSAIRRDLACLSSMLSLAEEEEWLTNNPVKAFLRARAKRGLREGEPRTRYLTQAEEDLVLQMAPPKAAQAIAFAIDTGLRTEEQFSLRWTEVDLNARMITVRKDVAKSKRERRIPLVPRSLELLTRISEGGTDGYVFKTHEGKRYSPISPTMYEALQKAVKRAEIPHTSWHDLRRTAGCRWLQDYGLKMHKVSTLLGHSSVAVTERHYAFLEAEDIQSEMDQKNDTFEPKNDQIQLNKRIPKGKSDG
jgi:integrase